MFKGLKCIGKYLIPNPLSFTTKPPQTPVINLLILSHWAQSRSHILEYIFPGTIPNQLALEKQVKSNHHLRSIYFLCFMGNAVSLLCSYVHPWTTKWAFVNIIDLFNNTYFMFWLWIFLCSTNVAYIFQHYVMQISSASDIERWLLCSKFSVVTIVIIYKIWFNNLKPVCLM